MERPVERQISFPLLAISYDPLSQHHIVLEMQMDWGLTGEVTLSYTTLASLQDFNRVLQYAQNAVADELIEAKAKASLAKNVRKKDPPF